MYPKDEKDEKEETDVNQCVICWDNKNVYKMQSFILVTNTCSCDSLFHGSCLFNWVHQTHSCPICRKPCQFNIKLLKCFLKNRNPAIRGSEINSINEMNPINEMNSINEMNPMNEIVELDLANYNTGGINTTKNSLIIIYHVTASLLKFCVYVFLYGFIMSLTMSIRREMIEKD